MEDPRNDLIGKHVLVELEYGSFMVAKIEGFWQSNTTKGVRDSVVLSERVIKIGDTIKRISNKSILRLEVLTNGKVLDLSEVVGKIDEDVFFKYFIGMNDRQIEEVEDEPTRLILMASVQGYLGDLLKEEYRNRDTDS